MKVLIVYDSYFGNTEKIAQAIGGALETQQTVELVRAGEVQPDQLKSAQLLIVGSPTRAFQPSDATKAFLKGLPAGALNGVKVAAFDTRIDGSDTKSGFLRLMIKLFGYAAKPMAEQLTKKGGSLALPPEGFFVKESEGPLREGELERAATWAKAIPA